YPKIESYLKRIYQSKHSWARCFTSQVFNTGIQSTQHVESHNNLIKTSINQSSLLITLYKTIQERFDKESMYSRSLESINFDYNTGRVQSISRTLFPEIVTLYEKYLILYIMAEIKQQIQQALWYRCYSFNILQKHCTDEPEYTNICIENNYDSQQIHLIELLNSIPYNNIL
ncbi:4885_t:CDS:1, partial [Gigaspora rosea]